MKIVPTSLFSTLGIVLAIAASSTLTFAQAPATPAPATSTTAGGATSGIAGATPAPKARPLGEGDKRFFKEASETMILEQKLAAIGAKATLSEEGKKAVATVTGDLKRVWEKFATLSMEKSATISQEISKTDAGKVERISKLKDEKLEKELLDELGKESKKATRLFESKTLQDPDLKKFVEDWGPTIKGHESAIEKAEKALGKKAK